GCVIALTATGIRIPGATSMMSSMIRNRISMILPMAATVAPIVPIPASNSQVEVADNSNPPPVVSNLSNEDQAQPTPPLDEPEADTSKIAAEANASEPTTGNQPLEEQATSPSKGIHNSSTDKGLLTLLLLAPHAAKPKRAELGHPESGVPDDL